MKNLISILILGMLLAVITGCSQSNTSETLLNDEEIDLKQSQIVFGDRVEDGKVSLKNTFSLGSDPQFVILLTEPVQSDQITISLNKLNDEDWNTLSESELPVDSGSVEITNGLSASIFEQTGAGAYQLVASENDEKIASGEFVVEEK
ncbi:hypothetical protein LCM20_10285 [Halobacillus litoralis]|uniref:hypothetical protein n=1 Tax=Halobacillus litoralis TaxID=45668 RepID=UPI001CD6D5AF|nr:hypothetical protein [Halobacillus litoralis]MCA0970979.1 hypothetical protein [Halobacillus litoralis]